MPKRKISLIVVPALLFLLLAAFIHAGLTNGIEGWVYGEAVERMSPALTRLVKGITHLGDAGTVIIFCLALFVIPKSRRTIALPVAVSVLVSTGLNQVLKRIFARERPDILRLIVETSFSFPSGHAMTNSAMYTMLILLIFRYVQSPGKRLLLSLPCLLLILAIGLSRVYLGVHYAGDILGGWLLGFASAMGVYFFFPPERKNSAEREENL